MKYLTLLALLVSCGTVDPILNVGECVTQHIRYETDTEFEENEIREYDEFFKVIKVEKRIT